MSSPSCSCSRAAASWDRLILSLRPCVATASMAPSAPHSSTRCTMTASGADWTSETTISAATIAATTHADSHLWSNRAVQMSGTSSTMSTPEMAPAARVSASADPV